MLELDIDNIDSYLIKTKENRLKTSLEIGFGSGENLLNLIDKADINRHFIGCEPYLNGLASFILKLNLLYLKSTNKWVFHYII